MYGMNLRNPKPTETPSLTRTDMPLKLPTGTRLEIAEQVEHSAAMQRVDGSNPNGLLDMAGTTSKKITGYSLNEGSQIGVFVPLGVL